MIEVILYLEVDVLKADPVMWICLLNGLFVNVLSALSVGALVAAKAR